MAYMKKVSSATGDPGYGSGWFKISEAGLNTGSKWPKSALKVSRILGLSPLHPELIYANISKQLTFNIS
jgi:hypothetical protein